MTVGERLRKRVLSQRGDAMSPMPLPKEKRNQASFHQDRPRHCRDVSWQGRQSGKGGGKPKRFSASGDRRGHRARIAVKEWEK